MCLIFIIVGIVPIMLIKHGILTNYQDQAVKQRISIIQSQSDLITAQISKTDYLSGEKSKITDVELQQMANLYNGRILVVNKEFRIIKDTDQTDEGKYIVAEEVRMDRATAGKTALLRLPYRSMMLRAKKWKA